MGVKKGLVVDKTHSSRPPGYHRGSLVKSIGSQPWISIITAWGAWKQFLGLESALHS